MPNIQKFQGNGKKFPTYKHPSGYLEIYTKIQHDNNIFNVHGLENTGCIYGTLILILKVYKLNS